MLKFITIVRAVLAFVPEIIKTINALEDAVSVAGEGEGKREVIRVLLEAAYNATLKPGADNSVPTFDEIWTVVEKVLGALVALFNKVGKFRKSTTVSSE